LPVLTIIAGPNGSGKSTLTSGLDFAGRENLLDPDAIARRLSPTDPRNAAIASGREVVRRIQNYLGTRVSFAVETTLASRRTLDTMRYAKVNGFRTDLIYICLDTPERGVLRVNQRVLQAVMTCPTRTSAAATCAAWQTCPRPFAFLTARHCSTTPAMNIAGC